MKRMILFLTIVTGLLLISLPVGLAEAAPTSYWKFDENNGSIAYDSINSIGNNHGKINGAKWQTGKNAGVALQFDGVDDYVNVDYIYPKDRFTISVWLKRTGDIGYKYNFVGIAGLRYYTEILRGIVLRPWNRISFRDYGGRLRDDGGNRFYLDSGVRAELNQWYHVAVTYDGYTLKIYVNGQEKNSCDNPTLSTRIPSSMQIGGIVWRERQNRVFNGIIDEVKIYNRALSAAEILDLQDYFPPIFASDIPQDVIGNWEYPERLNQHLAYAKRMGYAWFEGKSQESEFDKIRAAGFKVMTSGFNPRDLYPWDDITLLDKYVAEEDLNLLPEQKYLCHLADGSIARYWSGKTYNLQDPKVRSALVQYYNAKLNWEKVDAYYHDNIYAIWDMGENRSGNCISCVGEGRDTNTFIDGMVWNIENMLRLFHKHGKPMGGNVWDGYWWKEWYYPRADFAGIDPDYYVMEAGLNAQIRMPDGKIRRGEDAWTYYPESFWGKMLFFGTKLASGQTDEYIKCAGKIAIHKSWWWHWPCREGSKISCDNFQPPAWRQTAVENLLTVLPNWENKNNAQNRTYNDIMNKYESNLSRANANIVYSINPVTQEKFVVFLNQNTEMDLGPYNTIKKANNMWQVSGDGSLDFDFIGNRIRLKNNSNIGAGYILSK